ncbi:uncharacterized protein LTR77_003246 [Saxophila tyrrhenica]|uniref:FHA domain-containing protein n=1 Tax=Saxophila tyrrhenica TaxID=1690608 RepID=A0AAV9PHA1_9PEZI|nr:hypothetical protein LTR77_003246 [Saxophila tyrrhenica]
MADVDSGSGKADRRRRDRDSDSDEGARKERRREGRRDDRPSKHSSRRRDDYDSDGQDSGRRRERRDRHRSSPWHERKHSQRSRSRERSHHERRSRSPPPKRRRRSVTPSQSPEPHKRSKAPLPSQDESFRGEVAPTDGSAPPPQKQKPNYKPTGLLAKEANTVAGTTTVLKYHEPPEARKPPAKQQWRMYVFKEKDLLDTIYLSTRSAWLMGRDEKVTDYLLEHPSTSKQHAVIQFRHRTSTDEFGDKTSKVKPYLIDLESANGTKLNGEKVKASRYVELVDGDVVGFGDSEREYVMMLPPAGT